MTNTRRIWFVLIWAGPFQAKLCLSWFVAATFREFRARGLKGLKQAGFLEVLPSFSSHFSSSRQSLCTRHGYFEKKSDQACFLWQYTPLKQKSAAPQGSPPPTQQIEIPMWISWVGRSTILAPTYRYHIYLHPLTGITYTYIHLQVSHILALADCPAMSFVLVCWHSRKWQPPIRGGLSQMLVLWLVQLNQIDSFCKNGILYAWGGPRSIERGKRHGYPPKTTVFPRPLNHFLSLAWDEPAQIRTNWFWLEMGQPKSGQTDFGLKWASPNQDKSNFPSVCH